MTSFDKTKTLPEQPEELLLALTLYGEARGEPAEGKRAVAWVVRNRRDAAKAWREKRHTNHPLYGDGSVAGVVLRRWQFSCWNSKDSNLPKLLEIVQSNGESAGVGLWAVLRAVASGVLADPPEWPDPTFGATHYCTKDVWQTRDGQWYSTDEIVSGRTKETVVIGNHVFAKVA